MLSYIKDRFLRREIEKEEKEIKIGFTVSALLIIVLLANVAYLNLFIIKISSGKPSEAIAIKATPSPIPVETATSSALPVVQTPPPLADTSSQARIRDYYLNLGSGINQSTDWADVPGTINTIDFGQYQNIKEVHLETNVNVPTANGTISVRLFNKTDNVAVWNSERTVQSQANGDLLISRNLIYGLGPKMYQVQMMSQLGIPANLIQARLHIVTQ